MLHMHTAYAVASSGGADEAFQQKMWWGRIYMLPPHPSPSLHTKSWMRNTYLVAVCGKCQQFAAISLKLHTICCIKTVYMIDPQIFKNFPMGRGQPPLRHHSKTTFRLLQHCPLHSIHMLIYPMFKMAYKGNHSILPESKGSVHLILWGQFI